VRYFDKDFKRVHAGMTIHGQQVYKRNENLYLDRNPLSNYGRALEGTDIIILVGMKAIDPPKNEEPVPYLVEIEETTVKKVIVTPKETDLHLYDVDDITEEMCNKGLIDLDKDISSFSRTCTAIRAATQEDIQSYEGYWEE